MVLRYEIQANTKTTLGGYRPGTNQKLGLAGLPSAIRPLLSCEALQWQCLGIKFGGLGNN